MGTKISEAAVASALDGTELVPLVQDGETCKVAALELGGGPAVAFGSTGAIVASRGVTSVTKTGTGVYEVLLAAEVATGSGYPLATPIASSARFPTVAWTSTTVITVYVWDAAGAAIDGGCFVQVFGL